MLRYVLLAVFVGVLHADVCKQPQGRICEVDVYNCCDNNFGMALNLTKCNGNLWDRVNCYRAEIENMFGTSVDGGLTVCSAWSDWMKCLGRTLQDCESVKFHVMQGANSGQAINIFTVYSQISFLCGPGLDTYVNNDGTIRNVFINYATQLQRCRDTFSNNVNTNWENRCADFRELIGCYQLPFQTGAGIEGGWWGCEYERSGVTAWLPECSEQCTATNNNIRAAEELPQ
ncbi:unnamed protein product, partial [Mesorhabditis spiculigera]